MEAQGLSQGSLRNSHRETHVVRRKPAPAAFQELARKLVESCSDDLLIRQQLRAPEKMEAVLKRGTFYAMENEGRADAGYLVFLPGKPAIYLQPRRRKEGGIFFQGSTLRLRVSPTVSEGGGSVLIATLDDVFHTLRLEDVWMWRGQALIKTVDYSKRREKLKEFVERFWVPDARLLGGIFTTVAQPISLEEFAQKGNWDGVQSVEFFPEQAGRRRMTLILEEYVKRAEAHAGLKQERAEGIVQEQGQPKNAIVGTAAVAAPAPQPAVAERKAFAKPVDKLPDVYDLYDDAGLPISRASVQQFALSQKLRAAGLNVPVIARWRPEFGGYEIAGLA
jgi:hypothetical protein